LPPYAANIAPAPSATTEYAPLDRPGVAKPAASTSVGPPSLANPDATATDPASTAILAAQALEATPNPDLPLTPGGTGDPLKAPSAAPGVTELVPRGSLVPLELKPATKPTFDVDAVHKDRDGRDLFDVDLDQLDDKPWRRPGANMADYFNYGMNEATWKNYARKQRELRGSESAAANPFAVRPSLSLAFLLLPPLPSFLRSLFARTKTLSAHTVLNPAPLSRSQGFATGNIQQAWADLSPEHKQLLMGTIMGFAPGAMPAPAQMAQMAQMGMMAAQAGAGAGAGAGGAGVGAAGQGGMGGMGGMGMGMGAMQAMQQAMQQQGMGMQGMSPAQQMAARNGMAQMHAQQQQQQMLAQQQYQQQQQQMQAQQQAHGAGQGQGGEGEGSNGVKREDCASSFSSLSPSRALPAAGP